MPENAQTKFKLAMVTPFPETTGLVIGGVESVSCNLIHSLCRIASIEIHVLAPGLSRNVTTERRDAITIHWIPNSRLPGFLSYWSTFRRAVHQHLYEIQPDLTHFQGVAGWTLSYDQPYVLTVHGITENDALFSKRLFPRGRSLLIGLIEKLGRQRAKNIIVINPYVTEKLGSQIRGRAWHIENPISRELFEIKREPLKPQVLYVGRVNQRKNVKGLLRAFREVHDQIPTAVLRVAGGGENAALHDCRNFARECGLEQSVTFLGNIDRVALHDELAQAACLALVSHQETAPMIIAEAMAAGVPVLASDINGIPHMVEHGQVGFRVNQNDTAEIAGKLIELLRDVQKNLSMGERCREVASERFHPDVIAAQTLHVYRHILEQPTLAIPCSIPHA